MKKHKSFFAALIIALTIPSSAFASTTSIVQPLGAGEWDYVGSDGVTLYVYTTVSTKDFSSGGGDFQVRVRNVDSNNSYAIGLYEMDPDNPDDLVGTARGYGNENFTFNVRNYVDGSNKKAELYVKIGVATHTEAATIYAYD